MRFVTGLLLALTLSQSPPKGSSAGDALGLLTEVGQRYADAKSYHIEAVEERTHSNELRHSWNKSLLKAIVAPGGRYRYEGRSDLGTTVLVSDGKTQWDYHVEEHEYTQSPVPPTADKHRNIVQEEMAAENAKDLADRTVHLAKALKSASWLPEETISVNGHPIECYVVHFGEDDRKTRHHDGKQEETVWIDKSRKIVVKALKREDTYFMIGSHTHIPIVAETTTLYPIVELDQQEPASTFTFVAPADAKLMVEFPNQFARHSSPGQATDLLGKPAPELPLKSASGEVTKLSSFRGKPVFIEFWATWCEPCVDLMPELTKLYGETADKGLVWLSIDNDEDPSEAEAFITREHIPWRNYHDEDGSLGDAFHREGIPLGVLIDAEGKITFCAVGYEIADLRAAIAKLGPQFNATAEAVGRHF